MGAEFNFFQDYNKEQITSKVNLFDALRYSLINWVITPQEAQWLEKKFLDESWEISQQARKQWKELSYELRIKFQEAIWTNKDGAIWKETIWKLKERANQVSGLVFTNEPLNLNQSNYNEKEKDYTLSKEDFQTYFEGENFKQGNIWNCWLVATVDSLVSYWGYEDLIRKSVTMTNEWFKIIMPLWSPKWEWKEVIINEKDFSYQISINWDFFNLVNWKKWIKALIIAYWKVSTWNDNFDVMNLEWWNVWNYFNTLIYWINSYSKVRENINWKKWAREYLWIEDNWFKDELKSVLEWFNTETDLLTVTINQGYSWYNKLYNYKENKWWDIAWDHEVSIEWTYEKDWKLFIIISNPWDSGKSYEISFEDLLESTCAYTLWSKVIKDNLSNSTWNDNWTRILPKSLGKNRDNKSLNQVILSTWALSKNEENNRWFVISRIENWTNYIDSRWKADTFITNDDNYNPTINIWNNKLSLKKDYFSKKYNNNENYRFQSRLYPQRLSVFINKMRSDYIDKKLFNADNQNPFYIWEDWSIKIDDNTDNYNSIDDKIKRKTAKFLWIDTTLLQDWSLLWIEWNNKEAKYKIVDFLNLLCRSNVTI